MAEHDERCPHGHRMTERCLFCGREPERDMGEHEKATMVRVSECCGAAVRLTGAEKEALLTGDGTIYYCCTGCGEPCEANSFVAESAEGD